MCVSSPSTPRIESCHISWVYCSNQ
jgi:hypothetical protein